MLEWEKRQKHHDAIRSLGPEHGLHQSKTGFIWKWEGAKITARLAQLGHSCLDFNQCKCKNHQA